MAVLKDGYVYDYDDPNKKFDPTEMRCGYIIMQDGDILPDTHMFIFKDELTAILTLFLFSLTFASKNLVIKEICYIDNRGNIFPRKHIRTVCTYDYGIDVAHKLINSNPDKYKGNPITVDYLNLIKSDVEKAIQLKFMPEPTDVDVKLEVGGIENE